MLKEREQGDVHPFPPLPSDPPACKRTASWAPGANHSTTEKVRHLPVDRGPGTPQSARPARPIISPVGSNGRDAGGEAVVTREPLGSGSRRFYDEFEGNDLGGED